MDSFAARTVPIYWGDLEINRVFNPKAFINVSDYASLDEPDRFEKWLIPIFERPLQESYRRNRTLFGRKYIRMRQILRYMDTFNK